MKIKIGKKIISNSHKTYFIADIAANHDGSLSRAKKLIKLCAKNGADCAKFQHFKAETIVSDSGFRNMKSLSHQKKWRSSVFDTYKKASINLNWTKELVNECKKYGIDFMTAIYDLEYVDNLDKYCSAYKIGSGDITWKDILLKIAKKNKPIFLATGASDMKDVEKALKIFNKNKLVLMQCNTNYTASHENFKYINLNVLRTFKKKYKNKYILGLSDHTFGYSTVLGAVTIGARVIEKHFTDNNNRNGPDHKFSMNPFTWKEMILETRNLERALGDGKKKIENNEKETVIAQRRGVWLRSDVKKGQKLKKNHLKMLRPCPKYSINPMNVENFIGRKFKNNLKKNNFLKKNHLI
ncbi:N-acetylneuraminate synthase family protein [Candidatus Pelagibacter sp.]|uniref:N-acetylneuraminate synthase family protein n=1 Tax=Candidatus Pelagibacter sp. TaxID=2024849 RepID=UPI003F8747B0